MRIVVYGTCQAAHIMKKYLRERIDCSDVVILENFTYAKKSMMVPKDVIGECDVFLWQPVSKKYGTDYHTEDESGIFRFLKPGCISLGFVYVFLDMWPLYQEGETMKGHDWVKDKIASGMGFYECMNEFSLGSSDCNLNKRSAFSIDHMREKEMSCNIKCVDFIERHYKKLRLMDTYCHPNGIVLSYIANQILETLGIPHKKIDVFREAEYHIFEVHSIYEVMKRELSLDYDTDTSSRYCEGLLTRLYGTPADVLFGYSDLVNPIPVIMFEADPRVLEINRKYNDVTLLSEVTIQDPELEKTKYNTEVKLFQKLHMLMKVKNWQKIFLVGSQTFLLEKTNVFVPLLKSENAFVFQRGRLELHTALIDYTFLSKALEFAKAMRDMKMGFLRTWNENRDNVVFLTQQFLSQNLVCFFDGNIGDDEDLYEMSVTLGSLTKNIKFSESGVSILTHDGCHCRMLSIHVGPNDPLLLSQIASCLENVSPILS